MLACLCSQGLGISRPWWASVDRPATHSGYVYLLQQEITCLLVLAGGDFACGVICEETSHALITVRAFVEAGDHKLARLCLQVEFFPVGGISEERKCALLLEQEIICLLACLCSQVEFLPVGGISEETSNALKASQKEAKKRTRKAKASIDGVDQSFEVRYDSIMKTNGGYMVDMAVNIDNRSTRHRVVVGAHYVQGQGLSSPEVAVESAMAALLEAKLPRQTEGLMSMGMFPTNYFSVAGAEQWFPEEFAKAFQWNAGKPYKEDQDKMWRFTRTRSYGAAFIDEQARMQREAEERPAHEKQEAAERERAKAEEEAREDAEYAKNAV
ncbi:hypothetical protein DUNSADRAFT_11915 [Dunaliella salina]|uniref:Uncharacterized protein n=1 Tax=Dunaliella salina TaxID=3046 RepID=A0ABQ7GCD7_DUNSA|nr:hypothetical protein DUNSADRAFT_11915 [Dunaliella salina]|eukprot:KAF5832272.1 hypothetical protein DUNSADRAFT_11915 [Dunaliella salina]